MKPTTKWMRIADLYRRFARDWPLFDYSDVAAAEMFAHESHGGPLSERNGFALGKKWMDVSVAMWREDIPKGLLSRTELEADGFPSWWLDRVLSAPCH